MTSFSFTSPSPMSVKPENHTTDNDPLDFYCIPWYYGSHIKLFGCMIFICVACVLGLLGNGTVIWLLGFRMKRTPFTIYILNLAAADFGVLTSFISVVVFSLVKMHLHDRLLCFRIFSCLFCFAYCMSQFLLTTISIDRCVSVLFPLWYRCHRPEKLSTVVCAVMWLLSFLVQGICLIMGIAWHLLNPLFYVFLVNAVVCLPLIMVSTLMLLVRFLFKSQQRQRGKLLMAILLTLFFYLIFAFPLNVILLVYYSPKSSYEDRFTVRCYNVTEYGLLCAILNSFVNPLLYFIVGRKKRGLCRENLRLILQRIFTEEKEVCRKENPVMGSQKPSPQENF